MKFCICSYISSISVNYSFLKPLNPVLGETFSAIFDYGTTLFAEITSHHPPISNYMIYGPAEIYKFYGYTEIASSASLNKIHITYTGKRHIIFLDGTEIINNTPDDWYTSAFVGTLKNQVIGSIIFSDKKNKVEAKITMAEVEKK